MNNVSIPQLSYNLSYSYTGGQPHAPSSIGNENLTYDQNGNLLTSINTNTNVRKYHSWDEENRMKLVTDQQNMGYYLYDGGGERTLKLTGQYMALDVNGMETINGYIMNHQTLYVNPYMVVKNTEYTKHYYIENQRIVSRLGGGFLMDTVPLFSQVYGFNTLNTGNYSEKKMDDQEMVTNDLNACGQPGLVQSTAGLYAFLSAQPNLNQAENDIYYYHSDHLGSTSYITNIYGMPSQHVDYVPFGETLLEEHLQTWQTPYKFNCKELDAESGLYYYGARYYDPQKSFFYGVDPHSDNYPSHSPFCYAFNNPLIFTDPTGMDGNLTDGVTIIFRGDLDNPAFRENVDKFKANIASVWGNQLGFDLSKVSYKEVSSDYKGDLRAGENMVTFGSGNKVSNVTGDKLNNVFINTSEGGNTAAHEFGHVLGLADRYDDGARVSSGNNSNVSRQVTVHPSSMYPYESDYDPYKNLMSNGEPYLTDNQRQTALTGRKEVSQSRFYIFPNGRNFYGDQRYAADRKSDGSFSNIGSGVKNWLGNGKTGSTIRSNITW